MALRDPVTHRGRPHHATAEQLRRPAVCFIDPCGIDAQRRCASAAVTEPASDGPQVDPGGQQLGRRVVPECVQVAGDPQFGAHLGVPVRDAARAARAVELGPVGEQERSRSASTPTLRHVAR